MTKERRLGRGLEALLGRGSEPTLRVDQAHDGAPAPAGIGQHPAAESIVKIGVYEIESNPFQPRRDFDEAELGRLAESIKDYGLLQPIVVRRHGNRYQLIAGERRLRAATKAGWSEVPAQIKDVDDRRVAELAIVENLQRKDLNPLEKAASFQQYLEQYACTQEELASRLKLDRSTIANLIRLMELPDGVQDSLRQGKITQGHARALLPLGDEAEQIAFCRRIGAEGLSVRAVEALVQDTIRTADAEPFAVVGGDDQAKPARAPARHAHLSALEQELRTALGTKVVIRQTARGRGRIILHFSGHDEFERLRTLLCARIGEPRSEAS